MKTMIQVHLSNFLSKNNSFLGMNDTPSTLSYMQKSVFFIHDYQYIEWTKYILNLCDPQFITLLSNW